MPAESRTAPVPALELTLTGLPEEEAAQEVWHSHFRAWLGCMRAQLPTHLQAPAYALGLTFCDDAEISALNQQWRGQEGSTDVLAFAILEAPIPLPTASEEGDEGWEPLELGDIVISRETAQRQAVEEGHSLARELLFLASHGLLHLLGWDHPDPPSLAAMLAQQDALLAATVDPAEGGA